MMSVRVHRPKTTEPARSRWIERGRALLALTIALSTVHCGPRRPAVKEPSRAVEEPRRAVEEPRRAGTTARSEQRCEATKDRAATRDGYPVLLELVDAEQQRAVAERFRAANPARWSKVNVNVLGYVEDSHAPDAAFLAGEGDVATKAGTFFERNASYFGVGPEHEALFRACADRTQQHDVAFRQYWGPHRIGLLWLSNESTSGHFLKLPGPPPPERDDAALLAPFIGLRGTVTTTETEQFRTCDPAPHGPPCPKGPPPPPHSRSVPHVLSANDLQVTRGVQGLVSTNDVRVGELRIVATIRVTLSRVESGGAGSGWTSHKTTTRFDFAPTAAVRTFTFDGVTGEPLEKRRVIFQPR